MASASINLKNPMTPEIKQAPIGFSWTVFLFGPFPPLFRSDWKFFAILLLAALVTFGLSNLVFAFIYNKMYLNDLLNNGYTTDDPENIISMIEGKVGRTIPRSS